MYPHSSAAPTLQADELENEVVILIEAESDDDDGHLAIRADDGLQFNRVPVHLTHPLTL